MHKKFTPPFCLDLLTSLFSAHILSFDSIHSPKHAETFLNQQCGSVNQRCGFANQHCGFVDSHRGFKNS